MFKNLRRNVGLRRVYFCYDDEIKENKRTVRWTRVQLETKWLDDATNEQCCNNSFVKRKLQDTEYRRSSTKEIQVRHLMIQHNHDKSIKKHHYRYWIVVAY